MGKGPLVANAWGGNIDHATNSLWEPENRGLVTSRGDISVEPVVSGFPTMRIGASSLQLDDCPDHFPTDIRSALQHRVSNPAGRANFRTMTLPVPGFAGSGQLMAGGDLGGIMQTSAVRTGHSESGIHTIEHSGRSTRSYHRSPDSLAKVTGMDQVRDTDRSTTAAIHAGRIQLAEGDRVITVGHSLGQPNALGAVEAVLRKTPAQIQAMVNMHGVTEDRWRLARSGRFLSQVWRHAPKAVLQAWLMKTGANDLMNDPDAYAQAMFGLKHATPETEEHRRYAVLDSPHAFLDATFKWRTDHLARLVDTYGDRIRGATIVTVVAPGDNLIPNAIKRQSKRYKDLGFKEEIPKVPTAHSIPRNMTPAQQQAFAHAFDLAYKFD